MMRGVWRLAGLLWLFLPLLASADGGKQDPHYWLQRMVQATHNLNYQGTFIYEHDGHLQTMRIIHSADDGAERERLVTLSGPSREVIRNGDTVTCILPGNHSVVVERHHSVRPFPITLPSRLAQLERFYTLTLEGEDRIADLPARHIAIKPRDGYRYGHNIWLDEDSGLLLKAELVDEKGGMVEQLLFTSVEFFDRVPPHLLEPQTKGNELHRYKRQEEKDETVHNTGWRVVRLPPGFREEVHRRHYMPSLKAPVEHFVFSDGLASISVFIERHKQGAHNLIGTTRMGAVNAFGRLVDGHLVTVVGEVPPKTVKLVAESVRDGKGQ
jgi:sigma-E factor negative regulatory protein RseB